MRTRPPVAVIIAERLGVLVMLAAGVACGDKTPAPATPSPVPYSLTVTGTLSLHHPGDTSQLTATATFTGGNTKDVTREASWSSTCQASVVKLSAGLVSAAGYGKGEILVSYDALRQSIPLRIAPDGALLIEGTVTSGGKPLAGVNVEANSAVGTVSTVTDTGGGYALPGTGTVTLNAESQGFRTETRTLTIERDEEVDLEMWRIATSSLSGSYTLTFTAAPSCNLPAEVMKRTWGATIEEGASTNRPEDLVVKVDAPAVWDWWFPPTAENGFTGTVDGKRVTFTLIPYADADRYSLTETIGTMAVYFEGRATGEATDQLISASFDGRVRVFSQGVGRLDECIANDHRLEFVRR